MEVGQNESSLGTPSYHKYHLVVTKAHGGPECHTFDTLNELKEALGLYHGQRVSCLVFEGERWNISTYPRKLLRPDGSVECDIHPTPKEVVPDLDGFLFDDVDVIDDEDIEFFK